MEWTAEGGTLYLTPPKGHQVGMHIAKAYLCVRETHPVSKMCWAQGTHQRVLWGKTA